MSTTIANAVAPSPAEEDALPSPLERRRFPRVKIALPGRYMTCEGDENPCLTVDVAAGGLRLLTARRLKPGARIVAYIRDLGRIEGVVVRAQSDGFALVVTGTQRKLERLVGKIEWIQRRSGAEGAERRLLPRLELDGAFIVPLRRGEDEASVEVVDISATGLAFLTSLALAQGERVLVGGRPAVVARLFDGGAAAHYV